jgi:glycosyltransferase involved in cell wall biosynthesis
MAKILLVGEHPHSGTGNGNMMSGILSQMREEHYDTLLFAKGDSIPNFALNNMMGSSVIQAQDFSDAWGLQKLLKTIEIAHPDLVLFVGIDVWRYADIYPQMFAMAQQQGFRTMALVPYDMPYVRKDWIAWMSAFDSILIYSKFGYDLTRPYLKNSSYFRPLLHNVDKFKPSPVARDMGRRSMLAQLNDNDILVGFIGNNQFRKNPMAMIEGFALAAKKDKRLRLYLHTSFNGVFNIPLLCSDAGLTSGMVYAKDQSIKAYPIDRMVQVYNAMDMFVIPSAFEGLSWTPLEAMLCGIPVIASNTTAHPELIGSAGIYLENKTPYMVPIKSANGEGLSRVTCCTGEAVSKAILYYLNENRRKMYAAAGLEQAARWVSGMMNIVPRIKNVLSSSTSLQTERHPDCILFAQYASAGDVLMTTQCFKGLKKKHPGKKLVYMTQKKFFDIVDDNPYIDQLIEWDSKLLGQYALCYNPHSTKIITGGFNSLDTKLHEMYPYFCGKLEPDIMHLTPKVPMIELPEKYVVIQTAGGDKAYRTYDGMENVIRDLPIPIVQIGSIEDPYCPGVSIDLRNVLSFKESAYVLENALGAVVIDSFPAHLCGSLGTPAIVLFGPAPARVTAPRDDYGVIYCIEPNRLDTCPIMATCWGAPQKRPCDVPCINTIDPKDVRHVLDNILSIQGV